MIQPKHLVRSFAILTVFVLATTQLYAFCHAPEIRVDDEFFVSDLVFTGTIVADQKADLTADGDYDGHIFTWRVGGVFHGAIRAGDLGHTYSGNDSGRFPLEAEEGHQVGRRFLLFAARSLYAKGST